MSISSLTDKSAAEKLKKNCSSILWTCLHHMVILRNQNKITDFLMILAWASPFNIPTSLAAMGTLYSPAMGNITTWDYSPQR